MSKLFRIKCPSCQNVTDIPGNQKCKCGADLVLPEDGVIQIYRKGSLFGCAVGFGIYLNGIPLGHLANKQSIRIPVPYGHYKLHMTHGFSRSCSDQEFDITPENRCAYFKGYLGMGFVSNTVGIDRVSADQMPPL